MKRHLTAIAVLLSLASPLSAQEKAPDTKLHWSPYVFMLAGQVADISITKRNFSQGCTEANRGAFGSSQPTTARLVAVKAAAVVPTVFFIAMMQKFGHQKAANVIGLLTGGIGFGAAGYNLTVNCGGAR